MLRSRATCPKRAPAILSPSHSEKSKISSGEQSDRCETSLSCCKPSSNRRRIGATSQQFSCYGAVPHVQRELLPSSLHRTRKKARFPRGSRAIAVKPLSPAANRVPTGGGLGRRANSFHATEPCHMSKESSCHPLSIALGKKQDFLGGAERSL